MKRSLKYSYQCGMQGFDGSANEFRMNPFSLKVANDIRFRGLAIIKSPGMTLFDSGAVTATPNCLAGIDWRPTGAIQRTVTVWDNGKAYSDKTIAGDIDSTTLITGLTYTSPVVLVEAGQQAIGGDKELYIFAANNTPYKLIADGSTASAISNISPDWTSAANMPYAGTYHDFYLVAWGGANARHNLYFSTLEDNSDFLTNLPPVVTVAGGQGDEVRAALSLLPSRLYVWKYPVGLYWVDTTNIVNFITPIHTVRTDVGGAGPNAVCRVGSDVWFIAANGHVYSLTAAINSEDLIDADVSADLKLTRWIEQNISLARIKSARIHYDDTLKEVHVYYTKAGGNHNNVGFIINLEIPNKPRVSFETRGAYFEAVWRRLSSTNVMETLSGGEGGLIYRINQEGRNLNGIAYKGEFQFPQNTLASPTSQDPEGTNTSEPNKLFLWLDVSVIPTGNYNLIIDVYIDGAYTETLDVDLGTSPATFDASTWDNAVFAQAEGVLQRRIKMHGRGRSISLLCRNSGLNEDFAISEIVLHYKLLGLKGTDND